MKWRPVVMLAHGTVFWYRGQRHEARGWRYLGDGTYQVKALHVSSGRELLYISNEYSMVALTRR